MVMEGVASSTVGDDPVSVYLFSAGGSLLCSVSTEDDFS